MATKFSKEANERFEKIKKALEDGNYDAVNEYIDEELYSYGFSKYQEDTGLKVDSEPSVQAGQGGDFFNQYDEDDNIIAKAYLDYECEMDSIAEIIGESNTLDEAVDGVANYFKGNLEWGDPDDDDEDYDEDYDEDEEEDEE